MKMGMLSKVSHMPQTKCEGLRKLFVPQKDYTFLEIHLKEVVQLKQMNIHPY